MKIRIIIAFLLSLLVGLIAINRDSFWIDEAFSAHYAVQPTVASWWHYLSGDVGSDTQMPLYMFYLWVWEKFSGSSEWALRAANIPWFLLAQAALWLGLRRWPRLQFAAVICAACDPFLWRYLNETRPYAMQYAGATVVLSCLALFVSEAAPVISARWVLAFGGGLSILCGSSALGIPWAGAAVLGLLCMAWGRARLTKGPALIAAAAIVGLGFAGLIGYSCWTLKTGHHGLTGVGHRLASLAFAAYEIFGFEGLGPSRIQVIACNPRDFVPFLPGLAPLAILFAGVFVFGIGSFLRFADGRAVAAALLYVFIPLGMVVALVYGTDFHAVGRHFTPMAPVAVLLVAGSIAAAWRDKARWQIGWTAALLLLWLTSSLETRFAARHRRDDYRDSATIARAALASGKRVWWAAAEAAGEYYHVPLSGDSEGTQTARILSSPLPEQLGALPPPDVVIFSKPVIFDRCGALSAYLQARSYRPVTNLPAFTIWEK